MRAQRRIALISIVIVGCARGGAYRGIEPLAPCPEQTTLEDSSDVSARLSRCVRSDGGCHGPWRRIEGSTVTYGQCVDGFSHGRFVQRTLDGREIGSYELREGSGEIVHRYASGAVEWRGHVEHGRPVGARRYFREDGITTMVERAVDGRVFETIGRHYPSEIDEYDQCDNDSGDGCEARSCAVSGREVSLGAFEVTVGDAAASFEVVRYRATWTPAPSERNALVTDAPLRMQGTISSRALVARLRVMKTFVDGGAFVRAAAGRPVTLTRWSEDLRADVSLDAGIVSKDVRIRCDDLTLDGQRNPNVSLDPLPREGAALRGRARTLSLAASPNGRVIAQLELDPSVRFARGSTERGWAQVLWQSWDWGAVSGWVRADSLLEAVASPVDRSDAHDIRDRDDCAPVAGDRAARLMVGARIVAAPGAAAWAEVTEEVGATVRATNDGAWLQVVSVAGLSYSDDRGGCRRLERAFVSANAVREPR